MRLWRTAALTRTFRELLRASSDYEHGKLDMSTFSPNLRVYLEGLNTAPGLKLLMLHVGYPGRPDPVQKPDAE